MVKMAEGRNILTGTANGPRKRDIQKKDDRKEYYGHVSRG